MVGNQSSSTGVILMSNVISKDVTCPKCGHNMGAHLYISINATNDPQFKEDLLSGRLLSFTCESCGYQAQYNYPDRKSVV